MLPKIIVGACLLASTFTIAGCHEGDQPDEPASDGDIVIINEDGSTSTGALFTPIDYGKSFYLDHVAYRLASQHLEIIGYDNYELPATVAPYARIKYQDTLYNVRAISRGAFARCKKIIRLILPSTLRRIEDEAFLGCENLSYISFPDSLDQLGDNSAMSDMDGKVINGAFNGCLGLTELTLPANLESIGGGSFANCSNLARVSFPENLRNISFGAFDRCTSLTSLSLPHDLETLGGFSHCDALIEVTVPGTVSLVAPRAFCNCTSLKTIEMGSSVETIGAEAFAFCSNLSEVIFPSCLTTIADDAFRANIALKEICLPAKLSSIGKRAFNSCTNLTSITSLNPIPPSITTGGWLSDSTFGSLSTTSALSVPSESIDLYRSQWHWNYTSITGI